MNNHLLWILITLLILIILGIIICTPPPIHHNHFVSSGALNFQGADSNQLKYSEFGPGFSSQDKCFNLAEYKTIPVHFHMNLFLEIPCDRSDLGTAEIETRFFINENDVTFNQNISVESEIGPESHRRVIGNISTNNIKIQPIDYNISTQPVCKTIIRLHAVIPITELKPGDEMSFSFEIIKEHNFHSHGNYDQFVCGNMISTCDNDFPIKDLNRYDCYNKSGCRLADDIAIFKMIPICKDLDS